MAKKKKSKAPTYWSDMLMDIKIRDLDAGGGHVHSVRASLLLILRSDPSLVCFSEEESKFVGKMGRKYFQAAEILQLFGMSQ